MPRDRAPSSRVLLLFHGGLAAFVLKVARASRRSVVVVVVVGAAIPGRFCRQSLSVGKSHKSLLLLDGTQEKGTQLFRVSNR